MTTSTTSTTLTTDRVLRNLFCHFIYTEYLHRTWDDINTIGLLHDYLVANDLTGLDADRRISSIVSSIDYQILTMAEFQKFVFICHTVKYDWVLG